MTTARARPTPSRELCAYVDSRRICSPVSLSIADNAISATVFKAMTAPRKPGEREENETEKGLRVHDKGFLNTAVIQSRITYIDGEAGGTSCNLLQAWQDHG